MIFSLESGTNVNNIIIINNNSNINKTIIITTTTDYFCNKNNNFKISCKLCLGKHLKQMSPYLPNTFNTSPNQTTLNCYRHLLTKTRLGKNLADDGRLRCA